MFIYSTLVKEAALLYVLQREFLHCYSKNEGRLWDDSFFSFLTGSFFKLKTIYVLRIYYCERN